MTVRDGAEDLSPYIEAWVRRVREREERRRERRLEGLADARRLAVRFPVTGA